jgi:transcriptional regulator GlxA family with amidase domain
MTLEQLEGAAALMGMIANTIANLAHHNRHLRSELDEARKAIGQRSQQRKELIRRAIDYMERNLETPVRVADVAREIALNPSYFCTVFAEATGHTPSDFLIELRIERAKEYLAHTQMSVMEVCVALGYSPSYFSRLFKRHTGYTPGQYALRLRTH